MRRFTSGDSASPARSWRTFDHAGSCDESSAKASRSLRPRRLDGAPTPFGAGTRLLGFARWDVPGAAPLRPDVMKEPWQHRFVQANGLRFHCVTAGAGPLLILLHGFPEFWYSWRHQIPVLARAGFMVVAPDLRGFNDSDKPAGVDAYRISLIVEDVAGVIRAFGHERALLVGHDWGGVVAYALAMFKPDLVAKLAVLNCPPPGVLFRHFLDGNLEQLRRSWYMFFFQLPEIPEALLSANNFRLLKAMAYAHARRGTFTARDLRVFTEAFSKPGALTAAINWYRNMFSPGRPLARDYPLISVPTLLIWGTRDHFLGKELTRGIARCFSGPFRLAYLEGVSHWVQQEAPEQVNRLLLEFLKGSHKTAR